MRVTMPFLKVADFMVLNKVAIPAAASGTRLLSVTKEQPGRNGVSCHPFFNDMGQNQVRLPSREPDPIAPVDLFGGGKSVRRIGQCCIGNREMGHAGLEWCV